MNLNLEPQGPWEGAAEYAYRLLRKNIIWAQLRPGECISPAEVAEALGSSRTPVQTALARLAGDSLLKVLPQRGSYVTRIDTARIQESVRMRSLMDQMVVRLLCRRGIDGEGRAALEENLRQQQLCWERGRLPEMFELDNAWHELAYRLSGMEHSFAAVQSICIDHQRMRFLKLHAQIRGGQTVEEHGALNQAIFNRDAQAACRLSYEHVQRIAWDLEAVHAAYPDYFENWAKCPEIQLDYHQEPFYFSGQ